MASTACYANRFEEYGHFGEQGLSFSRYFEKIGLWSHVS